MALLRATIDFDAASKVLGHASIETTRIYTWIGAVESDQKVADALLIRDRVVHAAIEVGP